MRFKVDEKHYNEWGTEKAFVDSDCFGNRYFIPRSQVKIIERIVPDYAEYEFATTSLIIEVPDWLIRKNDIPIFKMAELVLVR